MNIVRVIMMINSTNIKRLVVCMMFFFCFLLEVQSMMMMKMMVMVVLGLIWKFSTSIVSILEMFSTMFQLTSSNRLPISFLPMFVSTNIIPWSKIFNQKKKKNSKVLKLIFGFSHRIQSHIKYIDFFSIIVRREQFGWSVGRSLS